MVYQAVFDIASTGYKSWHFPAYGLVFVVVAAMLTVLRGRIPERWSKTGPWFLVLALLWTVGSFVVTYSEYRPLTSALESGKAQTIAGVVSNFKPMPRGGHALERFCVESACFEYSDYSVTSGFNNTSSHGGPIREGLPVRVTHTEGKIVKLEVGKGDR